MNILWDFRLFSYGYATRGVGGWVSTMADAILGEHVGDRIIIWGEKNCVPSRFQRQASQWIDYVPCSWRNDLFMIPVLTIKNRIDIFHYWIALGPLFRIGLGLCHPFCKTCLTIHDCGVEFWNEVPMCASTKKTYYWKFQKVLCNGADKIVCNSSATQADVGKMVTGSFNKSIVLYPPLHYNGGSAKIKREKRFITLGGDAHKNTHNVIKAFQQFYRNHPAYSLAVLGECEGSKTDYPGVSFEGMERYSEYLENSAGCIVCSLHEGLGLPILEAMMRDCPLVLSDIPVFHEIGRDAGIFVDPHDCVSISTGIEECAIHGAHWTRRSSQGAARYAELSAKTGEKFMGIYQDLIKIK
jgi:glycosyltransferase involved in cell wall biosynthesis